MDKMIIYRDWKEALSLLSPEKRCLAWEALMDYAFDGIVPEEEYLNLITVMMRMKIDKDKKAYADVCNKRAEAGKRGGLKSGIVRRSQAEASDIGCQMGGADTPKQNEATGNNLNYGETKLSRVKQTKQNEHNGNSKYNRNDKEDKSSSSNTAHVRMDVEAAELRSNLDDLKRSAVWKESMMRKYRIGDGEIDTWLEEFYSEMICRNIRVNKPAVFFVNWLSERLKDYGPVHDGNSGRKSDDGYIGFRLSDGESLKGRQTGGEIMCGRQSENGKISRIQSGNDNNGAKRQDKFQQRRGTDAVAWTEKDFEEAF